MTGGGLRHLVLFRLHDDIDDSSRDKAIAMMRDLGTAVDGIREWQIALSLDSRKGQMIIQNGLFVDDAALQTYRSSPEHQQVVAFMTTIADWWVGDYIDQAQ